MILFNISLPVPFIKSAHTPFTSSSATLQRPDHKLYKKIDWDTVKAGQYAVVDPLDTQVILYLSKKEYIIQSRVAISNDVTLVVLATPSDNPLPTHDSDIDPKNSPHQGDQDIDFLTKKGRQERLRFLFITPFLHWTEVREEKVSKKHPSGIPPTITLSSTGSVIRSQSTETSKSDTLEYLDKSVQGKKDRKGSKYQSMIVVNRRNFVNIIRKWGEILHFRLFGLAAAKGLDSAVAQFSSHLLWIFEHNGIQEVIVRLKIYLHVTLAYASGDKIKTTDPLGRRVSLSHGLPSCLPASTRHAIRSKCVPAIRAWTSMFGMYKGLRGEWDYPSYKAITRAPLVEKGNSTLTDFRDYCSSIFTELLPGFRAVGGQLFRGYPIPLGNLKTTDTYVSTKGGPNGKSLISSHWDLVAWLVRAGHELGYFNNRVIYIRPPVTFSGTFTDWLKSDQHPFKEFLRWCTLNLDVIYPKLPWGRIMLLVKDIRLKTALTKLLFKLETLDLVQVADIPGNPITSHRDTRAVVDPWTQEKPHLEPKWCHLGKDGGLDLAKLVSLFEAAGKVRNIVMFDWVSQQVLLPLHNFLFELLRGLPTDATFDQEGEVKAFAEKDYKYIASYDLKAATETISTILYRVLLSPIVGPEYTDLWIQLLVDRDVRIADGAPQHRTGLHIRYNRGQPMGALSSWASMSLVHHAIVQFSAYRVNPGFKDKFLWFKDYLVLGDDIVIADKAVAQEYLRICTDLGIQIGLPKSFESNEAFFNFAGQSYLARHNISPISFKEELSCHSPGNRLEMAIRLVNRGILDITSNAWLAPLLRAVVPRSSYKKAMDHLHSGKGVHHVVTAVLVTAFGQLDKFLVNTKLIAPSLKTLLSRGLSVYGYFHLISGGPSIFSKSPEASLLPDAEKENPALNEAVLGLIAQKANDIYRRFMAVHPVLLLWKNSAERTADGRVTNPSLFFPDMLSHIAPLLWPYPTFGKKVDELLEWESTYRRLVKTIIVTYSLQPITLDLFEHTLEMKILEVWELLLKAEEDLPLKPDVVLGKDTPLVPKSPDDIYRHAERRFTRWANHMEMGEAARREPTFSIRGSSPIVAGQATKESNLQSEDS